MIGLAPHTGKIIDMVAQLDCIRPYWLVGGTALSLQLHTRQSEDLDFQKWRTSKKEKMEVKWDVIEKELSTIGEIESRDIYDFDHVEFRVAGVKFSFYACDKYSPIKNEIIYQGNIKLADILAIGAMKMEVMLRRNKFRDYYDLYSILQSGVNINTLIDGALQYSRHRLKSKNLLSMLTRGELFSEDENFHLLEPIYNVSTQDIENYIKSCLQQEK